MGKMVAFGRGNSRRPANHKAGQLAATERLSRQAVWGAAMDLGEWLKGLGLGQYEETFHEHEIDADVLPDLTEADLEKIGLPLGARKRLMKGIASLASKEAPRSAEAPALPPEISARARLQQMDLAERRPITVMFCDLVGSTNLAAKLDAEDWRNLVNAYLDDATKAVTGLGGHVAQAARRRADGALRLSAGAGKRCRARGAGRAGDPARPRWTQCQNAASGPAGARARIGLESGPVVVEVSGEVFGEAPNIAARVQAVADPSTVLITDERPAAGRRAFRR